MVDLIYGRGVTDIIHEMPFYIHFIKNILSIKLFHSKPAIYGSVDVNNICNLHCSHCYWWLNRKNDEQDLSIEDWKKIIKEKFKKQHIFVVTLVGGEPLLRPDIIKAFCDEMPRRVCVVTNGTFPLQRFEIYIFTGYHSMEQKKFMIVLEEKDLMQKHVKIYLIILKISQNVMGNLHGKTYGLP